MTTAQTWMICHFLETWSRRNVTCTRTIRDWTIVPATQKDNIAANTSWRAAKTIPALHDQFSRQCTRYQHCQKMTLEIAFIFFDITFDAV
jgi:hypothetical protein